MLTIRVTNPTVNPAGNKIAYENYSRVNDQGVYHSEVWMLDLINGEEKMVAKNAVICSWLDNHTVAFKTRELTAAILN